MADRGRGRGPITRVHYADAVHHTALLYPADNLDYTAERAHIATIERYHVAQGYGVFGYHGIGFPSGRFYLTGSPHTIRSHIANRNDGIHGWCLAGLFTNARPTDAALHSLRIVLRRSAAPVVRGHRDLADADNPTACPGDTLNALIPSLLQSEPEPPDDMPRYVSFAGHKHVYALIGGHLEHVPNPTIMNAQVDGKWPIRTHNVNDADPAKRATARAIARLPVQLWRLPKQIGGY